MKHWCLRKFHHLFSFICVSESQKRAAQRQLKKQLLLLKMVRCTCPASVSYHIYEYIYKNIYIFHSQIEPRTATQCFSLFINSCFISSISLVFHRNWQHGVYQRPASCRSQGDRSIPELFTWELQVSSSSSDLECLFRCHHGQKFMQCFLYWSLTYSLEFSLGSSITGYWWFQRHTKL